MSTTEHGNDFRDKVAALLRAAGFSDVQTEPNINYKNVDILSVWMRHTIEGPLSYAIEVKNYANAVPLDECSIFVAQYGEIVRQGYADRAWLVSKGPVSAKGVQQIRSAMGKNLNCFTFEELHRRLFGIDSYLADIVGQYAKLGLDRFYIRPQFEGRADVEGYVLRWLDNNESTLPLAILGSYGQGKSTFALHLAHQLILKLRTNPTTRIPILIPLGEIQNEQSVEGLICKIMSFRYRIENFHYHLFSLLNENGHFVLLFDGFDEMRHGMTTGAFAANIEELLKLDVGKAKLIILGRPAVFKNDREARAILFGRQFTLSGQEMADPHRRALHSLELRDFTSEEAAAYVRSYFPHRVGETIREANGIDRSPDTPWLQRRMLEILDPRYRELIMRPVHAQMMCDIATDASVELDDISKYDLYDQFTHYLIHREMKKKGRYPGFDEKVRRNFNASVAWWFWMQGNQTAGSLFEIPIAFCIEVTEGVPHDFDEERLKRELLAGCLVEKRFGTVYFPHRSLQEFLVADYVWNRVAEDTATDYRQYGDSVLLACKWEVADFIVGRIKLDQRLGKDTTTKGLRLIRLLDFLQNHQLSQEQFHFFFSIAQAARISSSIEMLDAPWAYVLAFFLKNGDLTFDLQTPEALNYLKGGLGVRSTSVFFFLWASAIAQNGSKIKQEDKEKFVQALIPATEIAEVAEALEADFFQVPKTSMRLAIFVRAFSVDERQLTVRMDELLRTLQGVGDFGILSGFSYERSSERISISVDHVERMLPSSVSRKARKSLRRFFSDTSLRYKLSV